MGPDVNNDEGLASLLHARNPPLSMLMLVLLSTINPLEKLVSRRKLGCLRSNPNSVMLTLLLTSVHEFNSILVNGGFAESFDHSIHIGFGTLNDELEQPAPALRLKCCVGCKVSV